MKIFLDGANFDEIKKIKKIDGYTFNPSLFKKLGAKDYLKFTRLILAKTSNKDVSIEVIGDDYASCYEQALKISKISKNIRVKIPITFSDGRSTKKLLAEFVKKKLSLT